MKIDAETCDQLNNVRYKEICTLIQNHHEENGSFVSVENGRTTEGLENMMRIVAEGGRNDVQVDELQKIRRVCDAERDSQKLISKTYSIRAPIGKTFGFIRL